MWGVIECLWEIKWIIKINRPNAQLENINALVLSQSCDIKRQTFFIFQYEVTTICYKPDISLNHLNNDPYKSCGIL